MRKRCRSLWGSASFGLQPSDKVKVILEAIFLLTYYGGFSYIEAYNLPVAYKSWFIDRISQEISQANKSQESGEPGPPPGSRGVQHNTAEAAALMGKHRSDVPSRLRRFT